MLYASSSRQTTLRLQRQASARAEFKRNNPLLNENAAGNVRPSSSSSSARPNTANGFRTGSRPSTPYKNSLSDGDERIRRSRDTFMLSDKDLEQFFRVFRYMAMGGHSAPPTTAAPPAVPSQGRRRKEEKGKNASDDSPGPIDASTPIIDSPQRHPWEENDATKITLSLSNFFATFQLSHTSNGGFLDGIFDLVGTKDLHAMTYGEFLEGACTFGMFKLDDMIRFAFFVLDKDGEGRIPRFQLLRFVESLHGKKVKAFKQAIHPNEAVSAQKGGPNKNNNPVRLPAAERQRACVDYPALRRLCADYPTMLEPMLLFQDTLRRRVMGEKWWRRKENEIERHFRTLGEAMEKKRRAEEKRLLKERKVKIRSNVGWIPYYLRTRSRSEAEKEHPRPIVSLEEETGEVIVKWMQANDKNSNDNDGSFHSK